MRLLRRLAVVTTAVTYLLVTVGGLVRATESGLGCGDDWPRCSGRLIPAPDVHAWIEYSHRLIAGVVVVLAILLAVAAVRAARKGRAGGEAAPTPAAVRLAVATVPIVLSQALLGAVVVRLELHAESVVAHLLLAMTLFAVLVSLLIETAPELTPAPAERAGADRHFARLATAVAGSALVLMLLGSYVSGRGAGLAFTDWPLFGGRLVPAIHGVLPDLHFAHRVLAAAVAAAIFALARLARRRRQAPVVTRLVRAAAALIGVEILIGAGNVWSRLSAGTRTAHLAVAALIWAVLVAAARLAWRLPAGAAAAPPPGRERDRAAVGSAT